MFEINVYKTTMFGFSWWTAEVFGSGEHLRTVTALTKHGVRRKADRACFRLSARALGWSVRSVKKFQWFTEKLEGK